MATFVCLGTVSAGAGIKRGGVRLTPANALESQVLGQMNVLRARRGLPRLRASPELTAAANEHSVQMARIGFFAHESSNGSSFWKRIQRFYRTRGFHYWAVGENLLWSSPSVDAAGALKMWLASPEHRRNMLSAQWRQIGLSAVHVAGAPGVYGGRTVTIVTTDFGVRR
ncbi:MAG: CAP domain-containing protein [Actinomycetota bacterium]|nr:CAP domain-containing protein [Actinomycetota bacterium]